MDGAYKNKIIGCSSAEGNDVSMRVAQTLCQRWMQLLSHTHIWFCLVYLRRMLITDELVLSLTYKIYEIRSINEVGSDYLIHVKRKAIYVTGLKVVHKGKIICHFYLLLNKIDQLRKKWHPTWIKMLWKRWTSMIHSNVNRNASIKSIFFLLFKLNENQYLNAPRLWFHRKFDNV